MRYSFPKRNKRIFIPYKFNPLNKKEIKGIIGKLLNFPPHNFKSAEEWFGIFHELSCAVSEAQTILELNASCNYKDKNNNKDLEEFEKNILSELLLSREKMMDIYLNSPFKYAMHSYESDRISKELRARKKFSIPELSFLQIEENKIIREYKHLVNTTSTHFLGREIPLSAILGKLHDPQINIRKKAFFTYWKFIKENEDKYQFLFDKLLENRRKQAQVAGCEKYTEIAFAELNRFDYGEYECSELRNSILKTAVPLITQLSAKQTVSLKEGSITPWNALIWPDLTPNATPAQGSHEYLIECVQKMMYKIHPSFGQIFEDMKKNNLMDIFPRDGKAPGAFSVTFQESERAFLFGNFSTQIKDVFTFIHEFGHCLHGYAVTNIKNILLRHPGFEYCEFASIGLELLASRFLNELWPNPEDAVRAHKYQLFQMLQFWPFMAMIDEWQHEVYSANKILNSRDRNSLWLQISKKYKPHLDWGECQEFEELGWFARSHLYTSPFYFIDYGIAQIGSLQLWTLSKEDYALAVEKYIKGLSLGAQVSLPELYQITGAQFRFDENLLQGLCISILKEISTA